MGDLVRFFEEIATDNGNPQLTDDILSSLEDFMIFSLDSEVQIHNHSLVSYLCSVISKNEWNGPDADITMHRKILNLLHLVRPNLMTQEQSIQILDIFFRTVTNYTGELRKFAFVYLADHLLTTPPIASPETIQNVLRFLIGHFQSTADDFRNADIEFLSIVVQSFKQLLTYAGMRSDQSFFRLMPSFADQLLRTIEEGLKRRDTPEFFPRISTYVGKALRLFCRILDRSLQLRQRSTWSLVSEGCERLLVKLLSEIPDDARFCHILENYLLCLCLVARLEPSRECNLLELFQRKMFECLPVLVLDPFCRSKRVMALIRHFRLIYDKTKKSVELYDTVLPSVWPMVGNIHLRSALVACSIVGSSLSQDLLRENPALTLDICEQICSALQIMKTDFLLTDFSSGVKSFGVGTWLDSNSEVYKLLARMVSLYFHDQSRISDSSMQSVLVRVSEYTSFLLDQWGLVAQTSTGSNPFATYVLSELSGKEFRDKVTGILELFCKIYTLVPANMLRPLLLQTMCDLLPTKTHHLYHRSVHMLLLKGLEDPGPYYSAFLSVISTRFSDLFLPNPQGRLLEMTKCVFQDVFITEKPSQQPTAAQNTVNPQLSNDLFNFVLKAMMSGNAMIIGLLRVFFFSIQLHNKPQKVRHFLNRLQSCPFSMTSVLRRLLDDPKTKHLISLLGLLLYVLRDSTTNSEEWVNIFLPALESANHLSAALYALFTYISKNFPQWISRLSTMTRNSLVCALVLSFTKLPASDVKYSRYLIRKIPDIVCGLTMMSSGTSERQKCVVIDGKDVDMEPVLNAMKEANELTDEDIDFLQQCYLRILEKTEFYEAITSPVINDLTELLAGKRASAICDLDSAFKPPELYSHLFLKHKHLPEYSNAVDIEGDPTEFFKHCMMGCYHKTTAATAISLVGEFLKTRIPVGPLFPSANSALLQGALFEYEKAKKVITETMFLENVSSEAEKKSVHEVLCNQFTFACATQRQLRKIAVLGMDFYAKKHNIVIDEQRRRSVIKNLPAVRVDRQKVEDPKRRSLTIFDVLHMYPNLDYPEPMEVLIRVIAELENTSFQAIPIEVQRLFKHSVYQDQATAALATVKFGLKMAAKLLLAIEPSQSANSSWERMFHLLKKDDYRQLFDAFERYIDKELRRASTTKIRSLVPESLRLFPTASFFPQVPCVLEDVKILRFFYRYSALQPTQEAVNWLAGAIRELGQQQRKTSVNLLASQLFHLLRELYCISPRLVFGECVAAAIDVALMPQSTALPLSLPIDIFVNDMPHVFMVQFAANIARNWTCDHIILLMKLLLKESLVNLRQFVLVNGCEALQKLHDFACSLQRFSYEFTVSHILCSTAAGLEKMSVESINIVQLMKFFRLLFDILKRRESSIRYKPAIFLGFCHIFLPLRFADQFVPGSDLVNWFLQEVVPLFITTHTLFLNQMFMRRLVEFLKRIPTEVRESVFRVLLNMKVSTVREKMLQLQLVTERSRFFPPEEEAVYTCGFSRFPKTPMFMAMHLNTVAVGIAMQNNTTLSDIEDCYVIGCSPVLDAAAVVSGRRHLGESSTLSRLLHVVEILGSDCPNAIGQSELTEGLLGSLRNVPHSLKHALVAFFTMSHYHRNLDFTNRDLARYALSVATRAVMSQFMPTDVIVMFAMPYLFKGFVGEHSTFCTDRLFEVCLAACKQQLKKPHEFGAAVLLPSILEVLAPFVDIFAQNPVLLSEIRDLIMDKEPHPESQGQKSSVESLRIKCILQLISVLACVLYQRGLDLPSAFQAKYIESLIQVKEYTILYKKAVQESSRHGGIEVLQLIMTEIYKYVQAKFQNVSSPLPNPFASVAKWFNEVPSTAENIHSLEVFLEAMKPVTRSQFVDAINALVQPLHPHVIDVLQSLIEKDFSDLTSWLIMHPNARIVFATSSDNIPSDLWRFDWFSIHPTAHIQIFARLIAPKAVQSHLKQFDAKVLAKFVTTIVPSLCAIPGVDRFVEYYCAVFPDSTLADCFWSCDHLTHDHPLTTTSFMANYENLFLNNLCEDAMGFLKHHVPLLSNAIAYHQLSQYRAARAYYLKAMDEHPDECYFYALCQLRNAYINVSLPMARDLYKQIVVTKRESHTPLVILPFGLFGETAEEAVFNDKGTTNLPPNLSQVYLPFLFRLAVSEEAYISLREMQQTTHNIADIAATFSCVWTRALDKQTAMSSALTWRYTMLQELQNNIDSHPVPVVQNQVPQTGQDLKDVMRRNRSLFARLLMKSGASYQALKVISQITGNDARQVSVSPQFLPRAIDFIKRAAITAQQNYGSLRWNITLKLRGFQELAHVLNRKSMLELARVWLSTFISIATHIPACIDPHSVFQRIQGEISLFERSQLERVIFYIALCLNLVRRDRRLSGAFASNVLAQMKDDTRCVFIRWLPHLLAHCSHLPGEFLLQLFQYSPSQFLLLVEDAVISGMLKSKDALKDVYNKARMEPKLGNQISVHNRAFEWVSTCSADIEVFKSIVEGHINLYQQLSSKITMDSNSFQELVEFCATHRPVFTTKNVIVNFPPWAYYTLVGRYRVGSLSLHCDGTDEGHASIVTASGEVHEFALISPLLYRYSNAERLFVSTIARMIENHQSSRTRSRFLGYPLTFLLRPGLLMVLNSRVRTQMSDADMSFPKLLMMASQGKSFDESPVSIKERKKVNIDRNFHLKYYVEREGVWKMNYLQMRQNVASCFGVFSAFRFMLAMELPLLPSVCFFNERLTVVIPGFLDAEQGLPQLPLTGSIRKLLPDYVLKGSFTTSWHTVTDVFSRHIDKVRIVLGAVAPDEKVTRLTANLNRRAILLGVHVAEETEKLDEPFPFILLDHLIENAENSLDSHTTAFAWI